MSHCRIPGNFNHIDVLDNQRAWLLDHEISHDDGLVMVGWWERILFCVREY
jgi:hypothetical protein